MSSQNYQPDYQPEREAGPGAVGYLALVLAWLVPGLGHMMVGQKARGLIFGITVHVLFGLGLLLGGMRAINPPDQPIWTYTQMLTGWPMLVSNRLEKGTSAEINEIDEAFRSGRIPRPEVWDDSRRPEREAFGKEFIKKYPIYAYHPKVQDVGSVYCGIAGMLNLLVIFDVLLRITGTEREVAGKNERTAEKPVLATEGGQ